VSDFVYNRVSFVVREEASTGKGIEANDDSVIRVDFTETLYATGGCGPSQNSTTAVFDKRTKRSNRD
jgi:hypothetical protein